MPIDVTVPAPIHPILHAVVLCVTAWCFSAAAQDKWDECNAIGAQSGPYKLLITDVIQDDSRDRLLKGFQERLSERVHQAFAGKGAATELHVIVCPRSQPQETDFGPPRIRSLHNQDVVTVLWGRRIEKSLRMRYVVVPYRRVALENGEARGGLIMPRAIEIPDHVASVAQMLDLLSQNSVDAASAYFALGIGANHIRADRHAEAQRFLCFAKETFRDPSKMGSVPKDIEAFLDQKLSEVARHYGAQGVKFARDHPIEKCGGS
jgi:hypothetical protein